MSVRRKPLHSAPADEAEYMMRYSVTTSTDHAVLRDAAVASLAALGLLNI